MQKGKIEGSDKLFYKGDLLVIENSYNLKIRTDKVISEVLKLRRSRIKALMESGVISVTEDKQQHKIFITIIDTLIMEKQF